MTLRVLDLFSGLGGFSAAFEDSDRWDVTTVELSEEFDADIHADVFDLRPSSFDEEFTVVLAGFPCTYMTTIRNVTTGGDTAWVDGKPNTPEARDNLALLYHTVGLIEGLSPKYWFLENPRGSLRSRWKNPEGTVWYCRYGHDYAKPTDLWGVHPPTFEYRTCSTGNDSCDHVKTKSYKEHGGGSGNRQGLLTESDAATRSQVPYGLSKAIRDAVEEAIDAPVYGQSTLLEVTDP